MILDAQLEFSNAQAITADAYSTNVLDLGPLKGGNRNIFDGEPMAIVISIDVAADFTTADETYAFQLRTDDNAAMSSPTTLQNSAILASALTLGSLHVLPVPVGVSVEQFLQLYVDVAGTTPSVTFSAYLQPLSMVQKFRTYADNSTISG